MADDRLKDLLFDQYAAERRIAELASELEAAIHSYQGLVDILKSNPFALLGGTQDPFARCPKLDEIRAWIAELQELRARLAGLERLTKVKMHAADKA